MADYLLRPHHEPASLVDALNFGAREAAVEAGCQAMKAILPKLKERLKR